VIDRIGYLLKRPVGRPPNEVGGTTPISPTRRQAGPCLEAERIKYAIRLPANQVLQN
jgi:hypothetical protein